MFIGIDFDGTCVKHEFPAIGEELDDCTRVLKQLVEAGHQLILWTSRQDHPTDINRQYLTYAVNWFKERGIALAGVNNFPNEWEDPFIEYTAPLKFRKPALDVYIDDKNLGGFPGWDIVYQMLILKCEYVLKDDDWPDTPPEDYKGTGDNT